MVGHLKNLRIGGKRQSCNASDQANPHLGFSISTVQRWAYQRVAGWGWSVLLGVKDSGRTARSPGENMPRV